MFIFLFELVNFPSFYNFGFFWNFGFIIFIIFFIQVFSGVILSFYMNFELNYILLSKIFLLNNVSYGWILLKIHCMLPNFLFFFIYLHIFKSLMNFMYYPFNLFISGIVLYLLFVMVVFTGYSMAGGSMGYWAMMVVFNILKYVLGSEMASCVFFSDIMGVSSITITKLFSIHYLFSFFIFIFFFIHVLLLHSCGSSNNLHSIYCDIFSFSSFMFFKDILFSLLIFIFLMFLTFVNPSIFFMLGDNFMEIQEFKSIEIVVEWYLSIFFIILSAMNNKFYGIFSTFIFISLFVLSMFSKDLFSFNILPISFILFIFFFMYVLISFSWYFFSSYIFSMPIFFLLMIYIFFYFLVFFSIMYNV